MWECKFVDYKGTSRYIGTEKDLYRIVEEGCGTDVADFVNGLSEKATEYAILEDEKWELEDKLGGAEIELDELEEEYDDLQEKYKRLEKFYNKVKDFVDDNYINTDKTVDDIFKYLKNVIKEL